MKKIITIALLAFTFRAQSQVAQTILVEHFTNTRCGVCANRNPGLYTNLDAQANVLHMAVHPSAPYSTCLLSAHNKTENDARTQFYGIFGSTPRLVIQGNVLSTAANYSAATIFDTYKNKTTPIAITTTIKENGESVNVKVVVKAVAAHTFTTLLISGFIVEETLNYAAPNGEQVHHDVFRKGLFSMSGETFNAPANGDSIVFEKNVSKNSAWNLSQIYALICVQQNNKQAEQSARSSNLGVTTGFKEIGKAKLVAETFPNPASNMITVKVSNSEATVLQLRDITGKLIHEQRFVNQLELPISEHKNGLYFIYLKSKVGEYTQKISILH